jgi:putative membrane protein
MFTGGFAMKRMGVLSLACAAAFSVAACNHTSTNGNETAATGAVGTSGAVETAVQSSDRDFVNHMLADGTAEIELGKLASTHAASADVKRFGEMMVQDHTSAGNDLKKIASTWNVEPNPSLDDKHRDLMDRLSKLNGADFDKAYIDAMIDDHQDAVGDLESRVDSEASLTDRLTNKDSANAKPVPERSDNAPKADLNAWSANALPVVQHHLDEAKMLQDKLDQH